LKIQAFPFLGKINFYQVFVQFFIAKGTLVILLFLPALCYSSGGLLDLIFKLVCFLRIVGHADLLLCLLVQQVQG
jgi:hypothetical protein